MICTDEHKPKMTFSKNTCAHVKIIWHAFHNILFLKSEKAITTNQRQSFFKICLGGSPRKKATLSITTKCHTESQKTLTTPARTENENIPGPKMGFFFFQNTKIHEINTKWLSSKNFKNRKKKEEPNPSNR